MKLFSIRIAVPLIAALFFFGCASRQPAETIPGLTPAQFNSNEYVSAVDNFLIILDASSSMDDAYNGIKKFTVAREIVSRMNQTLPELGQNSGLRSFGHSPAVSDKLTVLFYGMEKYSTTGLNEKLNLISAPGGTSAGYAALTAAGQDLMGVSGKTAVIIISDGQKAVDLELAETMKTAQELKDQLGPGLCFYTILVGDDPDGVIIMDKIAKIGDCGFAVNADKLLKGSGMGQFVEDVFLTKKIADTPIAKTAPAPIETVIEKGPWVIGEAYFDFDKVIIKSEAFDFLDQIAEFIIANPEIFVTVQGHTDSIGTKAYNDVLAVKRAQAVKAYLTGKGIDENRLTCEGFGFSKPTASNKTADGRSLNRRVEIHPVN